MTAPTAAPRANVIEKPMLFSAPMVRAILKPSKTMTRRIINLQCGLMPEEVEFDRIQDGYNDGRVRAVFLYEGEPFVHVVPHPVGSRIWVRETLYCPTEEQAYAADIEMGWRYSADDTPVPITDQYEEWDRKKMQSTCVSIHMPRWASRITLEVTTDLRVERLQDITPQDAIAEGIERVNDLPINPDDFTACWRNYDPSEASPYWNSPIDSFYSLWASINGRESLQANPLVWVYTFKHLEREATG